MREVKAATRVTFIKNLRTKVVSFVNRRNVQEEPMYQTRTETLILLNADTTLSELLVTA